ncbi:MAG: homoserine dehydrogenase [Anaerolineales bacterium]|jgi:homoserine dehydrogenase
MAHYKLALLGFGNVGQALARLLLEKQNTLEQDYHITFTITGIATGRHGAAIDPQGLDVPRALQAMTQGKTLDAFSMLPAPKDAFDFIRRCDADVLFENTPVNYENGQPALDHLRTALETGMYAITANKGPVVHGFNELTDLAQEKGLKFYFESAVMDGAPIFSLYRETLPGARLTSLKGVLNSTTNMILTRMEQGESFDQAVAYCQEIGIAETDPSGDVDGWDAAIKVAALVTVIMGVPLKPQQVSRLGIRGITADEIARAKAEGKRWKLVCSAQRAANGIEARVAPEMVAQDSPLYSVNGTTSIVQLASDVLGLLSVIEADPGPRTTAYGLFADFLNTVRH